MYKKQNIQLVEECGVPEFVQIQHHVLTTCPHVVQTAITIGFVLFSLGCEKCFRVQEGSSCCTDTENTRRH